MRTAARKLFLPSRSLARGRATGFSLVELLTVMAIAALLTGLLVIGVRGFNSSVSRRSAVGTLMGILDQARSVAVSDGRATYVVFVSTRVAQGNSALVNPEMWGRAYALFEDPVLTDAMTANNAATAFRPQQRSTWLYLSTGLAFKCADNGDGGSTARSVTAILPTDIASDDYTTFSVPQKGGGTVTMSLPYVKFDAAGQIVDSKGNVPTPAPPPLHVLIFEGTANGAGAETFTHRQAVNGTDGQKYALDEIVLKPTTGRARYTLDPYFNSTAAN